MLLPWIALLGTFLASKHIDEIPEDFWKNLSISATYYLTPALTGILTTAAVVLMCYKGYPEDNIPTTAAGVFGLMIVLFPCNCDFSAEYVGFFQLQAGTSHIIHCISAVCFFLLLSYISLFLFTRDGGNPNRQKLKRNKVYIVCGIGMLAALILMPLKNIDFFAKTFIIEAIALTFFGISWLVKGQAFGLFADK